MKADHQTSGASIIAHWSMRRIQPLQQRTHLGFQYTGETDPSRFSRSKITEDKLKEWVTRLLKNVVETANIVGTFRAGRRPREVPLQVVDCSLNRILLSSGQVDLVSFVQINSANYQSRPPLPEVLPEAHTNSSVHLTTFALLFVRLNC